MSKKYIYISLLALIIFSCDSFVLKKEKKEEIIKERLDKLNWNSVDQPPLFDVCEEKSEEELNNCFQNTITDHIHNFLIEQNIKTTVSINDTIWIPLLITKDSEIILEDFELPSIIISEIPNLKEILIKGISSLPNVKPAHTRSTPVSARYKLPLVIHME